MYDDEFCSAPARVLNVSVACAPYFVNSTCAVASVACPQKSTSWAELNQRKSHAPTGCGLTKAVSARLFSCPICIKDQNGGGIARKQPVREYANLIYAHWSFSGPSQ